MITDGLTILKISMSIRVNSNCFLFVRRQSPILAQVLALFSSQFVLLMVLTLSNLTGRNRYQLEVPDSFTGKLNGSTYVLQSQRKGYKRYYTSDIKDMVAVLTEAEEKRDAALKDTTRGMFSEFDKQ